MFKELRVTVIKFVLSVIMSTAFTVISQAGTAGLLFYAPFDGRADAEIAGGNRRAVLEGHITYSDGVRGRGILMTGSNRCVFVADDGNINRKRGTVELWVKPKFDPTEAQDRAFLYIGTMKQRDFIKLEFRSLTKGFRIIFGYMNGDSCQINACNYSFTKDQWLHLAFTWDDSAGLKLYLNGQIIGGFEGSYQTLSRAPKEIMVDDANAVIDEFYVFDRALSSEELYSRYQSVLNQKTSLDQMTGAIEIEKTTCDLDANSLARVDVVPTPKNMDLGHKAILIATAAGPQAVMVLQKDNEQAQFAAKAINDRIKVLGGQPLPLVNGAEFDEEKNKDKNLILLGGPEVNQVTKKYWVYQGRNLVASMPPEQGYIIETLLYRTSGVRHVFVLAGTDSQGTYYAASTFRELLLVNDGKILAAQASIRDWPDRKDRWIWGQYGRNNEDKEYWALFKSTGVEDGYHPLTLVNKENPSEISESGKALISKIEYGRRLGFGQNALIGSSLIWNDFRFLPSGEWKELCKNWDCVDVGGLLYCWSRDKELHAYFSCVANAVRAGKFQALTIHFPDADPSGYWSKRCPKCKAKWGDDLVSWAKAQCWLAGIFIEEIRKLNPDLKLIFILRPYDAASIDDVNWRWEETVKLMRENIPFDNNCYICVREDSPDRIQLWRQKWNNMKMMYYLEIGPSSPIPFYEYWGRYLDSYMAGSPDDIIWPMDYRGYYDPVNILMALERLWNRRSNGPGLWPRQTLGRALSDPKPGTPGEEHLLLRTCRVIFGYEAGPYVAEVYRHGLFPSFAANPVGVQKRYSELLGDIDTGKYFQSNLEAARKAYAAMQKVVDDNIPVRPEAKCSLAVLYRISLITLALAEGRIAIREGEKCIAEGNDEQARKIVTAALDNLKQRIAQLDKSDVVFKHCRNQPNENGNKSWKDLKIEDISGGSGVSSKDRTAGGRCAAVEAALKDLLKNKEVVLAEIQAKKDSENLARTPIPGILAKRTSPPITIDGQDKEEAWKDAAWVGPLVRTEGMQYSRADTRVAALYDDQNLYVFFKCRILGNNQPVAKNTQPDEWSGEDEYVELMLAPDRTAEFYQIFVNAKGVIGDIFYRMPESGGGLNQCQSEREAAAEGLEVSHPRPIEESKWSSDAKVKVTQERDMWKVELAIPFESLRHGPFADLRFGKGGEWTANFCRSIPKTETMPGDYSSLTRAEYKAYWKFPKLIFE